METILATHLRRYLLLCISSVHYAITSKMKIAHIHPDSQQTYTFCYVITGVGLPKECINKAKAMMRKKTYRLSWMCESLHSMKCNTLHNLHYKR